MSTIVSGPNNMNKCPSKKVDAEEHQECTKNGLVNGLGHIKDDIEADVTVNMHKEIITNLLDAEGATRKSSRKARKKKHKVQLDSNENLNESKVDENETNKGPVQIPIVKTEPVVNKLDNKLCTDLSDTSPSCSNSVNAASSDLEKLVLNDNTLSEPSAEISYTKTESAENDELRKKVEFVPYESELQMPMIMKIIQKDLSEPYSIYTYRYFIHNWPKLCFLAMCEGQCVGAIVCKLDLHRKVIRRGYIAMLAVDQKYRNMNIGSTLVQMAIHEMTNGDADEVVLETEVTNKPALKLYEKLGFVRDKRLFRYYLNGVDALRLKLWLR
ncbi:N-alpha-acetyltransferase 30-like [Anthonomus grandis grandis]|uniref:N-alpha-acetyltransferase 30-like n=1 Tax=Anthonomus grandis grandis TaxID=2921223 RepID=UPI002165AC6D|nr:N-alpha-acetyltransferase 30-like [Anthonomus grandis grandis]